MFSLEEDITNSGPSNVVDIYNTQNNSWTTSTLSQPRSVLQQHHQEILFFLEEDIDGYRYRSNVVDIYNTQTNSWTTSTLSLSRFDLAQHHLEILVFFGGGYND